MYRHVQSTRGTFLQGPLAVRAGKNTKSSLNGNNFTEKVNLKVEWPEWVSRKLAVPKWNNGTERQLVRNRQIWWRDCDFEEEIQSVRLPFDIGNVLMSVMLQKSTVPSTRKFSYGQLLMAWYYGSPSILGHHFGTVHGMLISNDNF